MYENYAKRVFERFLGTDADYVFVCRQYANPQLWGWGTVPDTVRGEWETIEEAVNWHFQRDWDIIQFYDLYAPEFENSMARSVNKEVLGNLGVADTSYHHN